MPQHTHCSAMNWTWTALHCVTCRLTSPTSYWQKSTNRRAQWLLFSKSRPQGTVVRSHATSTAAKPRNC